MQTIIIFLKQASYSIASAVNALFKAGIRCFLQLLIHHNNGFQSNKPRTLDLSICKESNKRFANSPLPINFTANVIKPTGIESNNTFLPKALEALERSIQ